MWLKCLKRKGLPEFTGAHCPKLLNWSVYLGKVDAPSIQPAKVLPEVVVVVCINLPR